MAKPKSKAKPTPKPMLELAEMLNETCAEFDKHKAVPTAPGDYDALVLACWCDFVGSAMAVWAGSSSATEFYSKSLPLAGLLALRLKRSKGAVIADTVKAGIDIAVAMPIPRQLMEKGLTRKLFLVVVEPGMPAVLARHGYADEIMLAVVFKLVWLWLCSRDPELIDTDNLDLT